MDLDLIKLADLMEGISREIKRVYGESPAAPAITAPQGQLDTPEQPGSTEATTTETPNQQESKFADLEDAGTSVTAAESAAPPATTTEPAPTATPSIPPVSSGSAIPSVTQDTQNAEQRIQKLQEELRAARLEAANQGTFNFQPLHL
jgi:hypothetical protein